MHSSLIRNVVVVGAALGLAGCSPRGSSQETAPSSGTGITPVVAPTEKPVKSYTGSPVKPPTGLGNAQGRVLFNGKGAAGIEVSLCEEISFLGGCTGKTFRSKTDKNGNYTINKVNPGEYSLAVRVFNTNSFIYPTSGILSAAKYNIEPNQTLNIRATNLFKTDLQIVSPKAGGTVKTGAPKLSWKAYPGATNYEVTLKSKEAALESSNLKTASSSVTPDAPLLNGTYEWKIEATNAEGTKIAETPAYSSFKVVGQSGSSEVKLLAPVAASTIAGTNIKFSWQAHPLATGYQIYLNSTSSSIPELSFQDVTGTQYILKKTLKPGQYFWTIIATKAGKKVAASPLQMFKVK